MNTLSNNIIITALRLTEFSRDSIKRATEVKRVSLCCLALAMTGVFIKGNLLSDKISEYIIKKQQNDGGWTDVEESLLAIKYVSMVESNYYTQIEKGKKWLLSQRNRGGGWGRTNRDISRIPITGLLLYLLPEFWDQDAVDWLINEWGKDIQGDTRLTYKGGFFLMGLANSGVLSNNRPLIEETYSFLAQEQNDDGGFGPWKDHPIGSDPWSTGIVLVGLLSYPDLIERKVIERAVNWLTENQLPNGLWPYHYMEEGSAYAYWGLVEALKYLAKKVK